MDLQAVMLQHALEDAEVRGQIRALEWAKRQCGAVTIGNTAIEIECVDVEDIDAALARLRAGGTLEEEA